MFHLKYITHIILNEERDNILYQPLDSRRWKDLNKINDGEKWWCDIFEKIKNFNTLYVLRTFREKARFTWRKDRKLESMNLLNMKIH
jgi:hypothetical protein